MKHLAIALGLVILSAPLSLAQTPPPPAQKAKFIPPVKGFATIDVQRVSSKPKGKDIVTILKVKNTSKGSLNLLKVEQYWYNRQSKQVSFGDYAHRKAPIQPGEIVEITVVAPSTPDISHDMVIFAHAYGKVTANQVKKVE